MPVRVLGQKLSSVLQHTHDYTQMFNLHAGNYMHMHIFLRTSVCIYTYAPGEGGNERLGI